MMTFSDVVVLRFDVLSPVVVGIVPDTHARCQDRCAREEGVLTAEMELVGIGEEHATAPLLGQQAVGDARVLQKADQI